jgi:coenzyme PQQ precursor peptide PqqA
LVGPAAAFRPVDFRRAVGQGVRTPKMALGGMHMAWTTPKIDEITCGMEINMYFPAEDDPVLF